MLDASQVSAGLVAIQSQDLRFVWRDGVGLDLQYSLAQVEITRLASSPTGMASPRVGRSSTHRRMRTLHQRAAAPGADILRLVRAHVAKVEWSRADE